MAHLVRSLADSARWIDARVGIGQLHSITSENMESQNEGEPSSLHAQCTADRGKKKKYFFCALALHWKRQFHDNHFKYSAFVSHNFSPIEWEQITSKH